MFCKIKHIVKRNSQLPEVICTDNSWALINACLNAFNGLDPLQYLTWCFRVLISHSADKSLKLAYKRHIICSTHYLKNLIKELKKKSNNQFLRSAIIFSFALLMDCSDIKQFNEYLQHIFVLFNSEWKEKSLLKSYMVKKQY